MRPFPAHRRTAIPWRRAPGKLAGWLVVAVTLASASLAAVRVYEIATRAYQHGHRAAPQPLPAGITPAAGNGT